jgi:hypothetical protein
MNCESLEAHRFIDAYYRWEIRKIKCGLNAYVWKDF